MRRSCGFVHRLCWFCHTLRWYLVADCLHTGSALVSRLGWLQKTEVSSVRGTVFKLHLQCARNCVHHTCRSVPNARQKRGGLLRLLSACLGRSWRKSLLLDSAESIKQPYCDRHLAGLSRFPFWRDLPKKSVDLKPINKNNFLVLERRGVFLVWALLC
jgi:hypothetical protein